MIYRRTDVTPNGENESFDGTSKSGLGEASQCIWLVRVRPQVCENMVKYMLLQWNVVKLERQPRGGFTVNLEVDLLLT